MSRSSFIPSILSTGSKTVSNFGTFFLIGYFYDQNTFSHYISISVLATFLGFLADLGFSSKIAFDFTKKNISKALIDSFIVRFLVFIPITTFIFSYSLLMLNEWILLLLFTNVVFSHWLESYSFKLRYENKYWLELFFSISLYLMPFFFMAVSFSFNNNLECVFLIYSSYKFLIFIFLFLKFTNFKNKGISVNVYEEISSSIKFVLDSLLLNIQPLIQTYSCKLILSSPDFVVFGYGLKIVQGVNTMFSAINNVFYPRIASDWCHKKKVKKHINKFVAVINFIPISLAFCLVLSEVYSFDFATKYFKFLDVLWICLVLIIIKLNSAILGGILTLAGFQKFRVKVNSCSLIIDTSLIWLFCSLKPFSSSVFLAMIFSCLVVFISYFVAIKCNGSISNLVFSFRNKN
ncbi:polysaccharide biosynthesis protein [Vibrio olivae]|uniref:Polysaccharide biosynthesis protein n=1 Tax=Vibrio olivae TaxID=1243002 RepID=A0ABV5HQ74_9VIBR